jgi:hypothetical protein
MYLCNWNKNVEVEQKNKQYIDSNILELTEKCVWVRKGNLEHVLVCVQYGHSLASLITPAMEIFDQN